MKNILKKGILALLTMVLLSSCDDFFDSIPGEQFNLDETFSNKQKTEQYLNNVYSYVPDETRERWPNSGDNMGGIWCSGSLETNITWSWHISNEWTMGTAYASTDWIGYWYNQYYKGIAKASTFIANVDKCTEAVSEERKTWKAQARALRAYYYFLLFRAYGPVVMLGEDEIPLDTPLENLMKERNSVDECINFIVTELDNAADDLPDQYKGNNLGRFDRASCKAFKAKILLYAASPLYNCNPDYADIKNADGKQLFPQDKSKEQEKWETARSAYEDFFREYDGKYKLYIHRTNDGRIDFYESYRLVTSGMHYGANNEEQIFIRLADHGDHTYELVPYHGHVDEGSIRGGLGFGASQQMVDLYFTDKGLRIVDDPDYKEYTGIPNNDFYGSTYGYNDPIVPSRNYFAANYNQTLKQWENREPRFYVCITFNGSTWINTETNSGRITTELTLNGNSGSNRAGHDAPLEGYGVRKMAPINKDENRHCSTLLRLADMYLGYAEALSACGQYEKAIEQINKVRVRVSMPAYGNNGDRDSNGRRCIPYPVNRDDVDKRIHRERLIELSYEWNRYFDVRRWKVADMAVGDDWIYPSYHKGGEGGNIIGMNSKADAPQFFEKVVTETRVFEKKHYLFPIPAVEIRRNPKMVQNLGWATETED